MNNLECAVAVLAAHREARRWADDAVAHDLLAQLGLDPVGDARHARPVVSPDITEAEVLAHEATAKEAVDKAHAARDALNAQNKAKEPAKSEAAADRAKAKDALETGLKDRGAQQAEQAAEQQRAEQAAWAGHQAALDKQAAAQAFVPPAERVEPHPAGITGTLLPAAPVPPLP